MSVAYKYIAYIDEAGDPGIDRIRPIDAVGGTEWMMLGCLLIRKTRDPEIVQFVQRLLAEMRIRQRKDLHFRHLSSDKKLYLCREMATLPARFFVLASNKKNMRQHRNPRAAAKMGQLQSSQMFYNFCVRLLLERVTDYCERRSLKDFGTVQKVKVTFSQRGGLSYGQTAAYTELLKMQARAGTTFLQKRQIKWQVLDHTLVRPANHAQVAGLQLADAIASAFFQAADVLDVKNDPQFAEAFAPLIATENGRCADYGVCLQPTPPWKAKLTRTQKHIFQFYGYRF